jgi:hypothetical protein
MKRIFLSYEFFEFANLRILHAKRIRYTNTNNTNFETNFSNLDVMIRGLYPNWYNSFFIFVQFVLKKINVATLNRELNSIIKNKMFFNHKNNNKKVF